MSFLSAARRRLRANFLQTKTTPFKQEHEGATGAKVCRIFSYVLGVMLTWFILWTLTKIPNYPLSEDAMTDKDYNATYCALNDDRRCYGAEMQVNMFAWTGYRARKLMTSPALFLSPHSAMACVLEAMLVYALICGYDAARSLSVVLFPLAFVFGLHVVPVEGGFPTRAAGVHINGMCIFFLWFGVLLGGVGRLVLPSPRLAQHKWRGSTGAEWGTYLEYVAWVMIGIVTNAAPVGEWTLLATANGSIPEGDVPYHDMGHGFYSSCECPALGWFLTTVILLGGFLYVLYFTGVLALALAQLRTRTQPRWNAFEAWVCATPAFTRVASWVSPTCEPAASIIVEVGEPVSPTAPSIVSVEPVEPVAAAPAPAGADSL